MFSEFKLQSHSFEEKRRHEDRPAPKRQAARFIRAMCKDAAPDLKGTGTGPPPSSAGGEEQASRTAIADYVVESAIGCRRLYFGISNNSEKMSCIDI